MAGDEWRVGAAAAALCLLAGCQPSDAPAKTGNVIFYHVDGTGIAHWQMARFLLAGPDGDINWDRLPHVAVYRGHAEDVLTPSSNAGATMHAYGVKAPHAAYGTDAQGEVTVRLEKAGRIVNGQGADTDIVIASAKAYINAVNKLRVPSQRMHPQVAGDV